MATYKVPCNHCGEMIDRDMHYCPRCESRSPFGYHCPACLKPIKREDAVCSGCGRKLLTVCPYCSQNVFAGDEKCEYCRTTLLIRCQNKRCNELQFFENKICTVCGKDIKNAKKQIKKIDKGEA